MNVILSCHIDSIFRDPMADIKNGILTGVCDNLAGQLACAQLMNIPGIHIEFTNDEENSMGGAKWVADHFSVDNYFIIVVDVTDKPPKWKKMQFSIENVSNVDLSHIRKALKSLNKQYKFKLDGGESEAWLYKEREFSCIEVDVAVTGGLHNLHNRARIDDILAASQAIKLLIEYIKDVDREFLVKPLGTKK